MIGRAEGYDVTCGRPTRMSKNPLVEKKREESSEYSVKSSLAYLDNEQIGLHGSARASAHIHTYIHAFMCQRKKDESQQWKRRAAEYTILFSLGRRAFLSLFLSRSLPYALLSCCVCVYRREKFATVS